ncbi:MAG: LytTR family transcriptional regulator [Cytophagales bacterium]|nr:LytTR family transcriptional regulator [Cytophaga sp.]
MLPQEVKKYQCLQDLYLLFVYLETQDDYVLICTSEGKFIKQQTMKYFEQSLSPDQFIRIHRSYLVNVTEIVRIEPYEMISYQMVLKNRSVLPISRNGYSLLKERLDFLFRQD